MLFRELGSVLDVATTTYYERPLDAEADALMVQRDARAAGAPALEARALVLLGLIGLNRGDLRGGFRLAAAAAEVAERSGDQGALAEAASLASQLHFWSGSYGEALREARAALELAELDGVDTRRLAIRRGVCVVMGNLAAPGWERELHEMVRLSVKLGDRWQEVISLNDFGHHHMLAGDVDAAAAELELGVAAAEELAPDNRFALAVLACTRAELRLAQEDRAEALRDVEQALAHQAVADETPPLPLRDERPACRCRCCSPWAVRPRPSAAATPRWSASATGSRRPGA